MVLLENAPVCYPATTSRPPASRKLHARFRHANARRFPAPAEKSPTTARGKQVGVTRFWRPARLSSVSEGALNRALMHLRPARRRSDAPAVEGGAR
jgi:hypothetical protein